MITEDYVSFEISKLLKDKGFNENCHAAYNGNGKLYDFNEEVDDNTPYWSDAPTLQMAMKWLRIEHGLFIRITEDITGNVYEWSVYQKNYGCRASIYVEDSYEQACEAAIKYCLENLI